MSKTWKCQNTQKRTNIYWKDTNVCQKQTLRFWTIDFIWKTPMLMKLKPCVSKVKKETNDDTDTDEDNAEINKLKK